MTLIAHTRPVIMVTLRTFSSKIKATGPVQSLNSLIEELRDEFDFVIISKFSEGSIEGVNIQRFTGPEALKTESIETDPISLKYWAEKISLISPDLIYCCSFFDVKFTTLVVLANNRTKSNVPLIVSPRGEFTKFALRQKWKKKIAFLTVQKLLRVNSQVIFHATSLQEKKEISNAVGNDKKVILAHDTATPIKSPAFFEKHDKSGYKLKGIFLGRVSPIKNLEFIVRTLQDISVELEFDWYGNIQDYKYFSKIDSASKNLPQNVKMHYKGVLNRSDLVAVLPKYDFMFAPSKSESFGHVIFEALSLGLPVLIGENTPWAGVNRWGAGLMAPLDETSAFVEYIQSLSSLDDANKQTLASTCIKYANDQYLRWNPTLETKRMFKSAIDKDLTVLNRR